MSHRIDPSEGTIKTDEGASAGPVFVLRGKGFMRMSLDKSRDWLEGGFMTGDFLSS